MLNKTYKIHAKYPSKIKEEELELKIYIKLTDEEKTILGRQQLQVNSQQFLEGTKEACVETYSLTFMIENIITDSKKEFDGKILVEHAEEADRSILTKYIEQLLEMTENHILKSKNPR